MKSNFKIILALLMLSIGVAAVSYYFIMKGKEKIGCSSEVEASIKAGRYSGFGPSYDTKLIACYGVITEEQWTESDDGFSLYDHKNKYEIVPLYKRGHYRLNGDKLLVFVKDNRPKDLSGYAIWYFVNGKEKLFTYRSYTDIPKFIAVDIYSGEVTIYPNNLNEIPETERNIFQGLEKNVN